MKLNRRGAATNEQGGMRVKTIIHDIDEATEGLADAEVNDFCEHHPPSAIVLDRYNNKLIYRILYKEEQ